MPINTNHCIMIINGKVFACGNTSNGKLGIPFDCDYVPSSVSKLTRVQIPFGDISQEIEHDILEQGKGLLMIVKCSDEADMAYLERIQCPRVISVSAGKHHSLAVTGDGSLWQFGRNVSNPPQPHELKYPISKVLCTGVKFIMASAGYGYSMAIDTDGRVWGCGDNTHGQMGIVGNGNTTIQIITLIPQLENIIEISASEEFSLALDSRNILWYSGNAFDSHEYGMNVNCNGFGFQKVFGTGELWDIESRAVVKMSSSVNYFTTVTSENEIWFFGNYTTAFPMSWRFGLNMFPKNFECKHSVKAIYATETFVIQDTDNKFHALDTTFGEDFIPRFGFDDLEILSYSMFTVFAQDKTTGNIYSWGLNIDGSAGHNRFASTHHPTLLTLDKPVDNHTTTKSARNIAN